MSKKITLLLLTIVMTVFSISPVFGDNTYPQQSYRLKSSSFDSFFDALFDAVNEEEITTPAPTVIPLLEEELEELNILQALFVSLNPEMTRDDIDAYIKANKLVKYAFTHNSAYYIGFVDSAIRQRERDRIGEAVDIDFTDTGTISTAEYKNDTGYSLRYDGGIFYYEDIECENSKAAMQQYLKNSK